MPGYAMWSKGYYNEYRLIEHKLNTSKESQREDFVSRIRTTSEGLMDAHFGAFFGGDRPKQLTAVSTNWFGDANGDGAMWLWDCTLSLAQIHQVMRESRARTVQLLLAGATAVEFWVQCSYARFHTMITWPSARPEDANLDNDPWPRSAPKGELVRVWVRTPFNSGYGTHDAEYYDEDGASEDGRAARDALIERLGDRSPEDAVAAGDFMTADDVSNVARQWRAGSTPWKGTPLAKTGAPGPLPDTAGLEVSYFAPRLEPLPSQLDMTPPAQILPRIAPGIKISWPGAGNGLLMPPIRHDPSFRYGVG